MTKRIQRKALGRGLSALISPVAISGSLDDGAGSETRFEDVVKELGNVVDLRPNGEASPLPLEKGLLYLSPDLIVNNPLQPRKIFREDEIAELAASIREHGVLQPIVVRRVGDAYEIIAGERRWRAAQAAGIEKIPALVKNLDDKTTFQIALVENLQRSQLSALEEARGYQRLIDEYEMTQEHVAAAVGKSRAAVANMLRLLKLPEVVQSLLENEHLSFGHAQVLLGLKEEGAQINLAQKVVQEELSVRELEAIVSRAKVLDSGKTAPASKRRPATRVERNSPLWVTDVTERFRNALGTKVTLRLKPNGAGAIEVEFFSESELDRILEKVEG